MRRTDPARCPDGRYWGKGRITQSWYVGRHGGTQQGHAWGEIFRPGIRECKDREEGQAGREVRGCMVARQQLERGGQRERECKVLVLSQDFLDLGQTGLCVHAASKGGDENAAYAVGTIILIPLLFPYTTITPCCRLPRVAGWWG